MHGAVIDLCQSRTLQDHPRHVISIHQDRVARYPGTIGSFPMGKHIVGIFPAPRTRPFDPATYTAAHDDRFRFVLFRFEAIAV